MLQWRIIVFSLRLIRYSFLEFLFVPAKNLNQIYYETVLWPGNSPRISPCALKFIIFIGAIISASYLFMLHRTSIFDESMILRQAEQQARLPLQTDPADQTMGIRPPRPFRYAENRC